MHPDSVEQQFRAARARRSHKLLDATAVSVAGLLAAILVGVLAKWPQWSLEHLFWILALVPSAVGGVNYWIAERPRFYRGIDELMQRGSELERRAPDSSFVGTEHPEPGDAVALAD